MSASDKPLVFRQSTLELAKCLYRFKKHELEGFPNPQTEATLRGTALHAMHSVYVNHLIATQQSTDYGFADATADRYRGDAADLFKQWVRERIFDPERTFGTEVHIALKPDFTPAAASATPAEAPYRGTLDRIEIDGDHADIYDLKTNFAIFQATTIQAIFYPWLLHKLLPYLKTITFHLDFVRWNVQREDTFTAEEIDVKEIEIRNQVKQIQMAKDDDDWPAVVNPNCCYCVLECPLVKAGMSRAVIGQIRDRAEAAAMAGELHALETRAGRIHDVLRQWASENGPIELEHLTLGFKKVRKIEHKAVVIKALNQEFGFAETRALRGDTREVTKIGRQYPEYQRRAEAKAKDKSTTKLVFLKPEPEDEGDESSDE